MTLLVQGEFLLYFPEANVYVDRAFFLNNAIRADRSHPTSYQHQRKQLTITENKLYQLVSEDDNQMSTKCPADGDVDKVSPVEIKENRLYQVSVGEESSERGTQQGGTPQPGTYSENMDQNDLLLYMAKMAGIRQGLEPVLNRYGYEVAHDAYTAWRKAGAVIGKYKEYVVTEDKR